MVLMSTVFPALAQNGDRQIVAPGGRIVRPAPKAPELSSNLLVFLTPGTDPHTFANLYGMKIKRQLRSDPTGYVFSTPSVPYAIMALPAVLRDGRTRYAFNDRIMHYSKRAFVPNDPFFKPFDIEQRLVGQWHLKNTIVVGRDANVEPA
jgi:hypothetical protein